ncbi:MAG: DUF1320 domain-containing protein, partial [Peptococcaceae bacterium]
TTIDSVRALCKLIDWTEIDNSEVTEFITKAQQRIDGRLRVLYQVPLADPVPDIVQSIAADMAASFVLDKHYSERMKDQTTLSEVYYRRAMRDLEAVIEDNLLAGVAGVVLVTPPAATTRPAIRSTTEALKAEATGTPTTSPMEDVLAKW